MAGPLFFSFRILEMPNLSPSILHFRYKELRQYSAHVPTIVVANKIDINPEVTKKEFQFATKRNLVNMFASAADGTNVVKIFRDVIELAVQFKQNPPADDFVQEALEAVDYFDQKEKLSQNADEEEDLSSAAAAALAALAQPVTRPKVKHEFTGDSEFV
jgi:50S ribosomal subunit-associated GTPase HflX